MDEQKRCDNCEHWQPNDEAAQVGICRLNPPSNSKWPETKANDWCGNYKKEEEVYDGPPFIEGVFGF